MDKIIKSLIAFIRILIITGLNAVFLIFITKYISDIYFSSYLSIYFTVFLLGLFNAVLWPAFSRFTLPLTVLTFGLGSLVLNVLVLYLVTLFVPGVEVETFRAGLIFTLAITIINTFIQEILAIDEDQSYFRNVIKKQAKKYSKVDKSNIPGLIILQFDGLAYSVLRRAILNGNTPTISRWLRDGEYRLERWETDWSSQTGASQAGILMGTNHNIPSFRWYEKSLGRVLTVGNPKDVRLIEEKITDGKGLLFSDGASRGNLFSGDAKSTLLTLSRIGNKDARGLGHAYYAFFANPYNLPRMIVLFFIDIFREIRSRIEQSRRDIWPRLTHMKLSYPLLRASMTVGQRDILFQTLIADVFEGKSVVYADFVGYDEVSHHTGPEKHETLAVLRDLDKQVKRLEQIFKDAPRPYKLVILSDHGQTQGATFKERVGYSLEDLVKSSIDSVNVISTENLTEGSMYLNAAMVEMTKTGGLVSKGIKKIKKPKNFEEEIIKSTNIKNAENIEVLASGCLGHIYFTKYKHRLTLEEIENNYPNLISKLINHPYIGFILVNSKSHGGIVIGPKGKYYLKTDLVDGVNPLANFGPSTANQIKRSHSFDNCADIMVNSFYDPVMDEVAAFEELVGSHGGLGGNQTHPFIYFPSNFYFPEKPILGASNINLLIKKWLSDLGQKDYKNLHLKPNKNKFI